MYPIYNPTTQTTAADGTVTRTVFPGNIVPKNLFDPTVVKALAAFRGGRTPLPNNGAAPGTLNYVVNNYLITSGTEIRPNTKISVKGDHNFSARSRISGYWGYNRSSQKPGANGPAGLPDFFVNYNDLKRNSDVFRGTWDFAISPTVFNHFYGGGNNWKENHDPPQATVVSGIHWKDKVCVGNVPDCDQNLVKFTFSNGYSQWGGDANNGSENLIKSFADDITIVRGRHTFKAGGQYQHAYYNGFGRQCVAGCINFDFKNTGRPGDTNFTTAGGSPLASMLLGYAQAGSIDTIRYIGQQWPSFSGFVQDDWRMRSNLVLNLGLRWETTLPPTGENDNWSDFDPTLPNPGAGGLKGALIYAGSGTGLVGTRRLADSYFKAFGPRLGVAWSVSPKTVIRTVLQPQLREHHHGDRLDSQSGLHPDRHAERFHQRPSAALPREGRAAGLCRAALRRSEFRQWPQHALVPGAGGHPAACLPELQSLDSAPDHTVDLGRNLLQRQPGKPPAGGPAAVQRARPEVSDAVRRDAAQFAHRFRGGRGCRP